MKTVIRPGQMVLVASFLVSSLAYGAPPSNTALAKYYCVHKGYCARTSNSRVMFIDPPTGNADSMLRFNLIDGEPIR
jgi:hypothetical protein